MEAVGDPQGVAHFFGGMEPVIFKTYTATRSDGAWPKANGNGPKVDA